MLRSCVTALAVLISLAAGALAADVRVLEPRAFGYFLGDTLTRTAEIQGGSEEVLAAGSLPVPGALNHWLELRRIETASERNAAGMLHIVTLEYQLFYAALDTRPLTIPAVQLVLQKGEASRTVTIPALDITVSPLREIFPGKESSSEATVLRPDASTGSIPVAALKTGMLISAVCGLAALALLAHHLAWWPFGQRPARAFSVAAREIASLPRDPSNRDAYDRALTLMHRAIDQTAGRRILPDDLGQFIAQHPQHRASEDELGTFFEASRAVFFGGDIEDGLSRCPPEKVRALADDLAAQERAAA